jgi:hypothetical protein
MHVATTPSNTRRKASLSQKRSCRALSNWPANNWAERSVGPALAAQDAPSNDFGEPLDLLVRMQRGEPRRLCRTRQGAITVAADLT